MARLNSQDTTCTECGSSDGKAIYTDGHTYCFVCHTHTIGDEQPVVVHNHHYRMSYIGQPDGCTNVISPKRPVKSTRFTGKETNLDSIIIIRMAYLSARRFAQLVRTSPTKVSRTDLSLVNTYGKVTVSELSLLKESLTLQRIMNTCRDGTLSHSDRSSRSKEISTKELRILARIRRNCSLVR